MFFFEPVIKQSVLSQINRRVPSSFVGVLLTSITSPCLNTGGRLGRMAAAWSGIPSQRTQATATCRVHIAFRSSGSFACFTVADTYIHNSSKDATAIQTVRMHRLVLCSLRVEPKTLVTQSPTPGYAMPTFPCGLDDGETFGGDNGKATTRRARVMLKSCPVPCKRRGFACCVSF